MSGQEINLDHVLLARQAAFAYYAFAEQVAKELAMRGELGDATQIPDEQAQILQDGSLEIFVDLLSATKRVSFTIPSGQWQRRLQT